MFYSQSVRNSIVKTLLCTTSMIQHFKWGSGTRRTFCTQKCFACNTPLNHLNLVTFQSLNTKRCLSSSLWKASRHGSKLRPFWVCQKLKTTKVRKKKITKCDTTLNEKMFSSLHNSDWRDLRTLYIRVVLNPGGQSKPHSLRRFFFSSESAQQNHVRMSYVGQCLGPSGLHDP